MKLLNGKKIAARLQTALGRKLSGKTLAAILVGNNPASVLYLTKKADMAKKLGAKFRLYKFKSSASSTTVIKKINALNLDTEVSGIIVQLPLPAQFNLLKVINSVVPHKDVDGLTDINIATSKILPATATGILELLQHYKINTQAKTIALIGFTRLLNVPLSIYFARRNNQVVVLQEDTCDMNELKTADIVITATGQPDLIVGRHIKKGAVVIDAGISRVGNKVKGDVDAHSVGKQAGYLTPVPGGVGPMTVVSLFANLLKLQKTRF